MTTLKIPARLNLDFTGYKYMSDLFSYICNCYDNYITLDFSDVKYFDAGFVAFLGGMCDYFKSCGKYINLSFPNYTRAYKYFFDSGLLTYINQTGVPSNQNAIPFGNFKCVDDNVTNVYTSKFIDLAPITLSKGAEEHISSNIIELFTNAIDHSESFLGCYACGHWMPQHNTLVFSIYDSGIGIPNKIKRKFQNYSSEDAIKWAFGLGNSTMQLEDCVPRGLGLYYLKDFICKNKGSLRILSNDIYYEYKCGGVSEFFKVIDAPIHGTLITVKVLPDCLNLYCLKGEQI